MFRGKLAVVAASRFRHLSYPVPDMSTSGPRRGRKERHADNIPDFSTGCLAVAVAATGTCERMAREDVLRERQHGELTCGGQPDVAAFCFRPCMFP